MNKHPITVLLAEDHRIVRDGLRVLIQLSGEFQVIAEANTGREAVELALALKPDIVIMDIAMPILNGIEATRQIKLGAPDCKVLMLSAHGDQPYVERSLAVGASGYLLKQNSGQVLLHAIRQIVSGGSYLSKSIAARIQQREEQERIRRPNDSSNQTNSPNQILTSRETEVLQLLAEGFANKQIASELEISIKTVEKHRQSLMDKLNIHQIAGLTRYAIESGVTESRIQDECAPKYS